MWIVTIDNEKCTGEGNCVEICPVDVLKVEGDKCVAYQPDLCEGCESCIAECPNDAITISEM